MWGAGQAAWGRQAAHRPLGLSTQRPQHEQPHGAAARPLPTPVLPGGAVSRCLVGWEPGSLRVFRGTWPRWGPQGGSVGPLAQEPQSWPFFLPELPVSVDSHKPPCGSPLACSHPVPSTCHSKSWWLFLECPPSIPTAADPRLSLTPGVTPAPSSRPHPFQGTEAPVAPTAWRPPPGASSPGHTHLASAGLHSQFPLLHLSRFPYPLAGPPFSLPLSACPSMGVCCGATVYPPTPSLHQQRPCSSSKVWFDCTNCGSRP